MIITETSQLGLDDLNSSNPNVLLEAVQRIKNSVIGSNRFKDLVLDLGAAPRLVSLMSIENGPEIAREAMLVINSLAKGTERHLLLLIEMNAVPILLHNVQHAGPGQTQFIETTLRCLRTIFRSRIAPIEMIYEGLGPASAKQPSINEQSGSSGPSQASNAVLMDLLVLAGDPNSSFVVKECVANILAASCKTTQHQNILCECKAVELMSEFLVYSSPSPYLLKLAALNLLAQLVYNNNAVSRSIIEHSVQVRDLVQTLFDLMGTDHTPEMRFYAAKVITYLFRASGIFTSRYLILCRTLHTLAMLCKKDQPRMLRAGAAEVLAYLTELDVNWQQTASICDHLLASLSEMLKTSLVPVEHRSGCLDDDSNNNNHYHYYYHHHHQQNGRNSLPSDATAMEVSEAPTTQPAKAVNKETQEVAQIEIRQAALRAFASLGANDEEIRKKIINIEELMAELVSALQDHNVRVVMGALKCLHSLSRSVQTLRTSFQDHSVWMPIRPLLDHPDEDVLVLVSAILCNLMLEFSPSKQHFLELPILERLCRLTRRENVSLRLNGVWALMNMTYNSDLNLKTQVLSILGIDQIFHLLSDSNVNIVMKTLGLMRNLISDKPHTDHIMALHGKQIMPAIIMVLEGDNRCEVKEQALCILINIAVGDTAKDFIMSNEDILKKLSSYLLNHNGQLQIAAGKCVNNLMFVGQSPSQADINAANARKEKLEMLSFRKIFQQLATTSHSNLFNEVKTALNHFGQHK